MVDRQTQEILDWEHEEIHDSQKEEEEEEPKYGSPEWYAWLQSQADPIHSNLYY